MSRGIQQSIVLTPRGYEVNQEAETGDFSGDVTVDVAGKVTIVNGAVTNAKMATVANGSIKGRATAGTGAPEDLTTAQFAGVVALPSAYAGLAVPVEYVTPEMDFAAAPGTTYAFNTPVLPAGMGWMLLVNRLHTTQRDGTVTSSAVVKIGTNVAHDNMLDQGVTPLGNNATTKNAWITPFGTLTNAMPDGLGVLTVEIKTSAVLGTATTFKGRFVFLMCPVDLAP